MLRRLPLARKIQLEVGEVLYKLSGALGKRAASVLFDAQWGYESPEWFDHRLHLLDPDRFFSDSWTASADNVIRSLPLQGSLLNLCSGDGFYDYYFYKKRASEITAIDFNAEAHAFALKHHSDDRITHLFADVLAFEPKQSHYDTVCIRGAIEHFSPQDQVKIFRKSRAALKPGGFFCGDTPAKRKDQEKGLPSHEYEWTDEREMTEALKSSFTDIETWSLSSADRTTLFWRCRK